MSNETINASLKFWIDFCAATTSWEFTFKYFLIIRTSPSYVWQGCQMVSFQTKNPNFGKFWKASEWKMFVYFMTIWNIFGHLVLFMAVFVYLVFDHLVYFSHFGMFGPRKIWQPWCRARCSTANRGQLSSFEIH
jgi:hypothetical protein